MENSIRRKMIPIMIIGLIFSLGIISLIKFEDNSEVSKSLLNGNGDYMVNPRTLESPVEMKMRGEFDIDGDKIDDKLEDQILSVRGQRGVKMDLIIEVQGPVTEKTLNAFLNLGGKITSGPWSSSIYGFAGTLPVDCIQTFAEQQFSNLLLIQPDGLVEATMAFAAQQVGVRPSVWDDFNLTGDWNASIAVLDSGIDPTHIDFSPGYGDQDFNSKIVGWRDFTAGGDNSTPYDDNGHGSHVAGIAAGNGFATRDTLGRIVATKAGEMSFLAEAWLLGPGPYNRMVFPLIVNQSGRIEIKFNWTDTSLSSNASIDNITLYRGITPVMTLNTTQNDTVHTLQWDVYPHELGVYYLNMTVVISDFQGMFPMPAVALRAEVHFPMQDLPDGNPLWTGIANNTRLVAVKVLNRAGKGPTSGIINGIEWVIANRVQYHITVMSISLAASSDNSLINAVENTVNSGIVVVVAAGNNGAGSNQISTMSPANADSVITVGSVNSMGGISSFSSQGGLTPSQKTVKPDVVAPGGSSVTGDIFSADANSGDTPYSDDIYPNDAGMMSGTSMATPIVSGAAALLIQALGGSNTWNYSREETLLVKGLLCMTATEVYPLEREFAPEYSPTLNRGTKDVHEGYGIINPYAAITALLQNITVGDVVTSTLYTSGNATFQNNRHAWAHHADLTANATHSYVFNLTVPTTGDFDIYLFSNATDQYGEPIILRRSIKSGNGGNEVIYYNCTHNERVYVVVKAVAGSGEFSLKLESLMVDDVSAPTISRFGHNPVIPLPGTPVTIITMVDDQETGIGSVLVHYTNNVTGGVWNVTEMMGQSDGTYTATIGSFPAGPVAYYINASNGILNWTLNPDSAPNAYHDFIVKNNSYGSEFNVLFVHDQDGESPIFSCKTYFEDALNSIGVTYDYWSTTTNGLPTYELLKNYNAVVWGMSYGVKLNASECMALWQYLENGGNLFISGHVIALMGANSTFINNYLKIQFKSLGYDPSFMPVPMSELGQTGDSISDNLDLDLNGAGGANDNAMVETFSNLSGSIAFYNTSAPFISGTGNYSAIRYSGSYKLVLCDFGYEAINNAADRETLLHRSLEFLGYTGGLEAPPYITEILFFNNLDPVNQTILLNGSAWDAVKINHTRFYIDNFWCTNDSTLNYSYYWDTTSWPDGNHTVTFVAYDDYWHANSTAILFRVDNEPPQNLRIDSLTNGSQISGMYHLTPKFDEPSGVDRVEYSIDGFLETTMYNSPYDVTWDTTSVLDGAYELNVTVFSVLNHSSTVIINVLIDNVIPLVNITTPLNYTVLDGIVTVQVDASDVIGMDRVELWVNGTYADTDFTAPYEFSWVSSDFRDGWNYVVAVGYDSAQNMNYSYVEVLVDNRAPENLSIAPLVNNTWITNTYFVNVTCQDPSGIDRVEFSVNNSLNATSTIEPYQWGWDTMLFAEGQWELNVSAFSILNQRSTVIAKVIIDRNLPCVNITSPQNSTILEGINLVQLDASDAGGIDRVEFWVNGTQYDTHTEASYDFSWDTTTILDGWNMVEVRVYDLVSQMNSSNVLVIVDNRAPEDLDIAPTTNGTWINDTYYINVTCTDLSGIDRVEFSVNGSLNATMLLAPYQWGWDTTLFADNWWELNVTAFSVLNHSSTVTATVLINRLCPWVNITAPLNSTILEGIVLVQAGASDGNGLDRVEFWINGTQYPTDFIAPYEYTWTTTAFVDDWYLVEVRAFDTSQRMNTSSILVLLDNYAPEGLNIAPTTNGTWISGFYYVNVTFQDLSGIDRIEYSVNRSLNATVTMEPYWWNWDTSLFADGWWELNVTVFSVLGHQSSAFATVVIDTLIPYVTITQPFNQTIVNGAFWIEADATDASGINRVEFYIGGTLTSMDYIYPYNLWWDSATVSDGWIAVVVHAVDYLGKENLTSFEFLVDNVGPFVFITTPASNSIFTGIQSVEASVIETAGISITNVEFYLNGSLNSTDILAPFVWSWDTMNQESGGWNLTVRAYTSTGRVNETMITCIVDHNASWVDITAPTPLLLVSGQCLVTFSAVDNYGVSTCQFYVDGYLNRTFNNPPYQFLWDTTLCGEGQHELNVTVIDFAGNQNSTALFVRVDNIAPMVAVYTPYAGIYLEGNVTFAANASDSNGVKNVTLLIDGSIVSTNTTDLFEFNVSTLTLADGIHTFTFTAYDMAGKANSTSFTIWINNYAPIITSLNLPGTIMAGSDIIATVQISDPFLASVVLHYSVDGGTTWKEVSLTLSSGVYYTGTILGSTLQAGTKLSYFVTATDSAGKIGYYQSYNASNPLQIEIGQSLMFYLLIIVIAAAAVSVTILVARSVRKGRSKGVSKKEVMAAEKAVTPPVKKISKKTGKTPVPVPGEVIVEPTKTFMPPLSGGKSESSGAKKLSVKFKVQGGQMITPSTGQLPAEEKAGFLPPAAEQTPTSPVPPAPKPAGSVTPIRVVYCATCNQYYEIAETDLQVGLTCSACSNPLQVTLICSSCKGILTIDIGALLKGKNMQAPCPNCGKPVRIL